MGDGGGPPLLNIGPLPAHPLPAQAVTSALAPTPAATTPAGPSPTDILAAAGAPASILAQAKALPVTPQPPLSANQATTDTLGG